MTWVLQLHLVRRASFIHTLNQHKTLVVKKLSFFKISTLFKRAAQFLHWLVSDWEIAVLKFGMGHVFLDQTKKGPNHRSLFWIDQKKSFDASWVVNKLKTRNASLLKNTQPLFCCQNKLPFNLEKVTYVHQDRENQRQPLFSEKYTTFFLKMNYLFLIIGCHHFFPKRVFFYSKQPKWVFSVQPEFFRSRTFRVFTDNLD